MSKIKTDANNKLTLFKYVVLVMMLMEVLSDIIGELKEQGKKFKGELRRGSQCWGQAQESLPKQFPGRQKGFLSWMISHQMSSQVGMF